MELLQGLGVDLNRFALGFQRFKFGDGQRIVAAVLKAVAGFGQMLAEQGGAEHGDLR